MDTYIEQIVVKKSETIDKIKIALLTIALILAIVLVNVLISIKAFQAFAFIGIFLEFGIAYGYWFLLTSFKIEYEYALTNAELDIDKIIAKRKRKRLITVKIKEVEIMAPVIGNEKNEFFNQNFKTVIDASSSPLSPNTFFITTHHEKLGHIKLFFTPEQRIIDICKSVAPRKVIIK
jgi:hypothetical protein